MDLGFGSIISVAFGLHPQPPFAVKMLFFNFRILLEDMWVVRGGEREVAVVLRWLGGGDLVDFVRSMKNLARERVPKFV